MKNIKPEHVEIKNYDPGATGKLHAKHATEGGTPTGFELRLRVLRGGGCLWACLRVLLIG
jgi:hypothetical protein